MLSHTNPSIDQRLEMLRAKNNAYINQVLFRFIEQKKMAIKELCDKNEIDEETNKKLVEILLSKLQEINFIIAFGRKDFKRVGPHESEIDYTSFESFILKSIPTLADVENFMGIELGCEKRKKDILESLAQIKKTINSYSNPNKKDLIKDFTVEIDKIHKNTFDKIDPNPIQIQTQVKNVLKTLQDSENNYYQHLTLFAHHRQKHSSLQTKINAAIAILETINPEKNIQIAERKKSHSTVTDLAKLRG